ncbi:unnamed protein product [marine sediment metagenome]|uniref:thymidine kinase n=1 Tax=marine sediment metagenome TaxID=412755 RepID=X1CQU9_9ZZZZ
MRESRNTGWIEVICGSMFSGKSEELIRRVRRVQIAKKKVQVFKPTIDNRYAVQYIYSHNGTKVEAINITKSKDILKKIEPDTEVIAIDESPSTKNVKRKTKTIIISLELRSQESEFSI